MLFTYESLNVYVMVYNYWRNSNNLIDAYMVTNSLRKAYDICKVDASTKH